MAPISNSAQTSNSESQPRIIKRLRGEAHPDKVFVPGLLASAESLHQDYIKSGPYQHIVIPKLVNDGLLRKVREELLAIHATRKETDIYRVFQTGDLANLDGLPESELKQLQSLLELRNALYSQEFRSFVEKLCGVGKLSASKADLSHNIYKEGCHLLCHDDVIGTRSVSYIIYLTDPEDPWRKEDGGGLELFPVVSKNTPGVHPTVVIPPAWNQMAMFAVQPGHSFHSVAEVVSVARNRPSISGWFHVLQPEDMTHEELKIHDAKVAENAENEQERAKASMDQLLEDDADFPFNNLPDFSIKGSHLPPDPPSAADLEENTEEEEDDVPLTEAEIAFLKPFVNPVYLKPSVISQANEKFCQESSIQLTSFLEPSLASALSAATIITDERDGLLPKKPRSLNTPAPIADYTTGTNHPSWTAAGPSHKHRFLQLSITESLKKLSTPTKSTTDPTADLATIDSHLFKSPEFLRLLYLLTSLKAVKSRSRVRRFRPGMDYTLATTSSAREDIGVLDATLCFVCERTKGDAEAWASDEVGGFDCYMAPDESNDDPAQYRAQKAVIGDDDMEQDENAGDGGALLSVSASSNCLNLVMREGEVMRFIKYVSARAPGSRWDVAVEYQYE